MLNQTLLLLVALAGGNDMHLPSWAGSETDRFQSGVVRADSIPTIVGPTVIAIVHGSLDSVALALDDVRAMASALRYQFLIGPESLPPYVAAFDSVSGVHYEIALYVPADRPEGYSLISPRRAPEFARGFATTAELRRWLWMVRRPPLMAWYLDLWPVALLSGVLVAASVTPVISRWQIWILLSLVAAGLSSALVAPVVLARAANPFHNMLERDVIAILILAAGVPFLVGCVALALTRRHMRLVYRLLIACTVGFLGLAASPIYALFVHCTSGDCL